MERRPYTLPYTQSPCPTSWILNPVEHWTYHMILPLRQYSQCSCWTTWILNIATWLHICCSGRPMTHLLYVRRVGQDHQSILDDQSGWPVRTPVKYLLYVRHIGQDHQSILDDLSGWPVRTQTNKYTEWIFSRYQAHPPVQGLNIRSVLG